MRIDPSYQRQKFRPITIVSGNIRYMRLFAGVLHGGSNDGGDVDDGNFQRF